MTFIIIGAAVLMIAFAILATAGGDKKSAGSTDKKSTSTTAGKNTNAATKGMTLSSGVAKTVIGDGAVSTDATATYETTDYTIKLTQYSEASRQNILQLSVYKPKTDKGKTDITNMFQTGNVAGVQEVDGYGDAAFWDPVSGQLNVMKNGNYYIFVRGSQTAAQRTLEQTKAFADMFKGQY